MLLWTFCLALGKWIERGAVLLKTVAARPLARHGRRAPYLLAVKHETR